MPADTSDPKKTDFVTELALRKTYKTVVLQQNCHSINVSALLNRILVCVMVLVKYMTCGVHCMRTSTHFCFLVRDVVAHSFTGKRI